MPSDLALSPPAAPRFQSVGSGARFGPRVLLALAVTLVPLLAYVLVAAENARQVSLDWLMAETRDAARQAAAQEAESLGHAARLLNTLSLLPQMAADPAVACGMARQMLAAGGGPLAGFAVHRPDGRAMCSTAGPGASLAIGTSHVRAALAAPGTVVLSADSPAGLVVARAMPAPSDLAADPGALPTAMPSAAPLAVLAVVLAPGHLPNLAMPLRRESAVRMLIDPEDGTVLAQLPQPARLLGQPLQAPRLMAALRAETGGGAVVVRDGAGVQRLFGYATLPDPFQAQSAAAPVAGQRIGPAAFLVGLPYDLLLAEADSRRYELWFIALFVALCGMLAGWMLTERAVLQPLAAVLARRPGHALSEREALESLRPGAAWLRQQGDLAVVAEVGGEMVLRLDAGLRVLYASPAARAVLGYAPDEMVAADLAKEPGWEPCCLLLEALRGGGASRQPCRITVRRKDDRDVRLEVRASRLGDGGFALVCRDVDETHRLEQELAEARARLAELALEDALTGLANRARLAAALDQEIRRAKRAEEPLSLVLVEIDDWQGYADRHGAGEAEAMLRGVARTVAGALRRPGDLAARYDTAMFAILLPITDRIGLARVVARLHQAFTAEAIARPDRSVTASIGAASLLPLGERVGPDALLGAAQDAVTQARLAGGNRTRLADEVDLPGDTLPMTGQRDDMPANAFGLAPSGMGGLAGSSAVGQDKEASGVEFGGAADRRSA